ncbi:hypothetical protein CH063_12926 [Colletotrichum higginsianum]|uniref:Uncharacterized protein n=1 Tax=Colletotrichum higginsianum (strain IMI 349063) TaxID=759273 RepID=H1VSD0_COLHI|nr:hypothetical protein CH063_12926 [Colletotrichum higginsianum]
MDMTPRPSQRRKAPRIGAFGRTRDTRQPSTTSRDSRRDGEGHKQGFGCEERAGGFRVTVSYCKLRAYACERRLNNSPSLSPSGNCFAGDHGSLLCWATEHINKCGQELLPVSLALTSFFSFSFPHSHMDDSRAPPTSLELRHTQNTTVHRFIQKTKNSKTNTIELTLLGIFADMCRYCT